MLLKNREKLDVKRKTLDYRAVFLRNFSPFTIHLLRLRLAADGQANDRTILSTSPAHCVIGKRKAEQRKLCDGTLLYPGKSAIGSSIDHAPFPYNPSGLWISKTYPQEVRQLRTGAGAG